MKLKKLLAKLETKETLLCFIFWFIVIQIIPPLTLFILGFWKLATAYLTLVNPISPFPVPVFPVCVFLGIFTHRLFAKIIRKIRKK